MNYYLTAPALSCSRFNNYYYFDGEKCISYYKIRTAYARTPVVISKIGNLI